MKILFRAIVALFCLSANLNALPLYYPECECGIFADAAVEGIYIENPDIGFYGLFQEDDTSAVVWDPDCLTVRWGGSVGVVCRPVSCYEPFRIVGSANYFCCDFKRERNLEEGGEIQLFAINGSGFGGIIPATQIDKFHFCHKETHANALVASTYTWCGGIILYPAAGYGFIYQDQTFDSELFNFELGINNGTVHECLETTYHGVNAELGIAKRMSQCWIFTIVPKFGIYRASTEFEALQTWGQLGFPSSKIPKKNVREVAYQGSLRGALLWEYCQYHIGGQAFVDYLSYVPGIINPREDVDGPARITKKNSFRYGGGLIIGACF